MISARLGFFGQTTHPEALNWSLRVASNGGSVSASTLSAVDKLCRAIDAAGIRDRFFRLGIFAGSNLSAALVPLYRGQSLGGTQYGNATDTNTNFISANYTEQGASGGLTSTGTGRYLNTGIAPSALTNPAVGHLSYYRSAGSQTGTFTYLTIGSEDGGAYRMDERSTGQFGFWGTYNAATNAVANAGGHRIVSRTSASLLTLYSNGASVGTSSTTITAVPSSRPWFVFTSNVAGAPNASYFIGTLRSYSIGNELTSSQAAAYYNAIQSFQTALGRNA